jgi:hypothetical protein
MTPLEEALALKEEIQAEMEFLKQQLIEVNDLIAELSEEETKNPYWTDKDRLEGRLNYKVAEIHAALSEGSRAERFYANWLADFHYTGIFATLTEEVDPEFMRMYYEAQSRHFVGAIGGATFVMAKCYDKEGNEIEGYRIPWNGNFGPHVATMKYQDDWASPGKLNRVRGQAEYKIRWVDREYRMAKMRGTLAAFEEKYPYYEPE